MKTYGEEKSLKIPVFCKVQLFFKIVQNLNCRCRGLQNVYDCENAQGLVLVTILSHYNGYFLLGMFISWFCDWLTVWPNISKKF